MSFLFVKFSNIQFFVSFGIRYLVMVFLGPVACFCFEYTMNKKIRAKKLGEDKTCISHMNVKENAS